ncbi:MAG: hypothetical protein RIE08_17805 [Acidimicrobiales bacterium]
MVDFAEHAALLDSLDVGIIAASVDDAATTADLVAGLRLTGYPVLHGLDPEAAASTLGAHLAPDRSFVHATGLLLRPDSTIYLSVYSTGPLGRLVAADVARTVEFRRRTS